MSEKELTLEEVREGIRLVVENDPSFRYPEQDGEGDCGCTPAPYDEDDDSFYEWNEEGCEWHQDEGCLYYHPDGSPSCVVGHYAHSLGLDNTAPEGVSPARFFDHHGITLTEEASKFLNTVQGAQDESNEWEVALARAEGEGWPASEKAADSENGDLEK